MPFLSRLDQRINYQLLGERSEPGRLPVALIHGLGSNLAFWYLGAGRHLGDDRSILLHDLRGHGASSMPPVGYGLGEMAADFGALLDALDIEKAHVVGHSHGARIALAFALARPDRVASLTVADTQLNSLQRPMRLSEWSYWPSWRANLEAEGVTTFPSDDAEIDFRLLAELGPRGQGGARAEGAAPGLRGRLGHRFEPDAPARISLRSRQMGVRSGRQWQALLETTSAARDLEDETAIPPARLPEIAAPTLLVYGQHSHCLPTSERLAEMLPRARRIVVPQAGHFFPIVKPRVFARALRTFMASAEQPTLGARVRPFATGLRQGRLAARFGRGPRQDDV